MKYLHTMVRVTNIEQSMDFYCNKLGMKEVRRYENEQGRFTLIFLAGSDDLATAEGEMESTSRAPCIELTYNWDPEVYTGGRNFGHLAYAVDNIYELCQQIDGWRSRHQPPSPRRTHGFRAIAGQYFLRIAAEGRGAAASRTMAQHAKYRSMVGSNWAKSAGY